MDFINKESRAKLRTAFLYGQDNLKIFTKPQSSATAYCPLPKAAQAMAAFNTLHDVMKDAP